MKNEINENKALSQTSVMVSAVFQGDCDKNIHWYVGCYSSGVHRYNECAYCKKRQSIELG